MKPASIKPRLRFAILATTALGALPAHSSDLPKGGDRWRLRPADVLTTGATGPAPVKARPVTEMPQERRSVRVVYPGLLEAR